MSLSSVFSQESPIQTKTTLPETWRRAKLRPGSREFFRRYIGLGALSWKSLLLALPPVPFSFEIEWGGRYFSGSSFVGIEKNDARVFVNPNQIEQMADDFVPFFGRESFSRLALFVLAHEMGHAWDEIVVSKDAEDEYTKDSLYKEAFADAFAAVALCACGTSSAFMEHLALWREHRSPGYGSSLALRQGIKIPMFASAEIGADDWFIRLALCEKIAKLHFATERNRNLLGKKKIPNEK